jgi:hypothetical protein
MKTLIALFFCALTAFAQTMTFNGQSLPVPCVMSAGLSDATISGSYAPAAVNAKYGFTFPTVGALDYWEWSKNDGAFSSPIAMTGAAQSFVDGLSVKFAATTGHTLHASCTVNATANGSLSGSSFIQAGVGSLITRNAQDKMRDVVSLRDFGTIGSATNASAFMAAAIKSAEVTGKGIYLPASPYPYLICNVSYSGTANIRIYGDGTGGTKIMPHSSCPQPTSDMIDITTTGIVELHDFSVDMNTNGSRFTSPGDAISITNATKIVADGISISHAQIVGLQVNNSSNVSVANSSFDHNWWFDVSVACALGGTASPQYQHGFDFHGNQFAHSPIGLGVNFFCDGVSVTGNAFTNSNLSFVQTGQAFAEISGNTFDGVADYGCTTACGLPGVQNNLYMEGASHVDVGDNQISNVSGVQGSITFIGSNLTLGGGPTIELPITHVSVHDVKLDTVSGFSILISAESNGPSPVKGTYDSIKNTTVLNADNCPNITSVDNFELSGNTCDTTFNGGFHLDNDKHGSATHNRGHNIGTAATVSYVGLLIDGSGTQASQDIDVFDNVMSDDSGNIMFACYEDATLIGGDASEIRHDRNECQSAGTKWLPAPAPPTIGTWVIGARIGDALPGATGATSTGWIATAAGVGAAAGWVPIDNLPGVSDGSYTVAYPTAPTTSQFNWGADATGAFIKAANPAGLTYANQRIISIDFDWIYGPTSVSWFHMFGSGQPKFPFFGGSGNQCITANNVGDLAGTGAPCLGSSALPSYANNAAAVTGGLSVGNFYQISGTDDIGVVHTGATYCGAAASSSSPSSFCSDGTVTTVTGVTTGTGGYVGTQSGHPFCIWTGGSCQTNTDTSGNTIFSGYLKTPNLAGTGNRCLYADSGGTVTASGANCNFYTSGTGISINLTTGVITNTAPAVALTGAAVRTALGYTPATESLATNSATTGITVTCTATIITSITCTVTDPGHAHTQN